MEPVMHIGMAVELGLLAILASSCIAFFGVFQSSPKWSEQTLSRRVTTASLLIAICITGVLMMAFFPDGPLHSFNLFH
jgi:hypothetical protein